MALEFDFEKRTGTIIKVIGVGGGGGNAVAKMFNQGIQGVDFAICNTDKQALANSPVDVRIQLGPHLTEGRGAGSKPEVGKQAGLESVEDIKDFLDDGTKMLFVTAGLGGGTGTGAAPIVAKAAKDMGILTVGIVTLPFKFEGMRRQRYAIEGLEELKKNVDAYLVISNDRLFQLYGDLGLSDAFAHADDILTTAAKGIAEIITVWGSINVDFEDVNTVMRGSGVAIMGNATAEGEDRARRAINDAMASPLLEDNDIRGAQHILLNITSGKKEITMSEIGEITSFVQEEAGYGTNLIWGSGHDASLDEKISVTLIATGFSSAHVSDKKILEEQVRVPLDESAGLSEDNGFVFDLTPGSQSNTVNFEEEDVRKTIEEITQLDPDYYKEARPSKQRSNNEPVATNSDEYRQMEEARRTYLRNVEAMSLDDPKIIQEMDNVPAYVRRKVVLDDTKEMKARADLSRFEISTDQDKPLQQSANSFLHENVD